MQQSFNAYIENSIREHWELVALSDFKGVFHTNIKILPAK